MNLRKSFEKNMTGIHFQEATRKECEFRLTSGSQPRNSLKCKVSRRKAQEINWTITNQRNHIQLLEILKNIARKLLDKCKRKRRGTTGNLKKAQQTWMRASEIINNQKRLKRDIWNLCEIKLNQLKSYEIIRRKPFKNAKFVQPQNTMKTEIVLFVLKPYEILRKPWQRIVTFAQQRTKS